MNTVEQWLRRPRHDTKLSEEMWDKRAPSFYEVQQKDDGYYPSEIYRSLNKRKILNGETEALELGAGTGRFTFPIAEGCRSLLATDISNGMLEYIKKNAIDLPIECERINWEELYLEERGWKKRFDLVYSVMCPVTQSESSLVKMTEASRGYCFIGQFINWENGGREERRVNDPHNDRDSLLAYFYLLWNMGFNPEIEYFSNDSASGIKTEMAFIIWNANN